MIAALGLNLELASPKTNLSKVSGGTCRRLGIPREGRRSKSRIPLKKYDLVSKTQVSLVLTKSQKYPNYTIRLRSLSTAEAKTSARKPSTSESFRPLNEDGTLNEGRMRLVRTWVPFIWSVCRRFFRPRLRTGYRRLEWRCVSKTLLYLFSRAYSSRHAEIFFIVISENRRPEAWTPLQQD